MKIKQETASKIGLFSAVMMIFGAVVGIGIFFKNVSVFRANNNNWMGVLFSWVIAIIMALCMALSFGELVTCKLKNKNDGLGGWASAYCGNGFGRYTKVSHSLIYFPVIIFAVAAFTGEACFNCITPGKIDYGNLTTLYIFLTGFAFFALFIILNMVASKVMSKFSDISGIIKFIPLIAVIVLGIIFGCLNAEGGLWTGYSLSHTENEGQFSVTGMIGSVPAILFAFEGYTIIGSISGDMKDPQKNVPLAIVIAMVIISFLNLAITIGCMTAGCGNVYDLMRVVFNDNEKLMGIFKIIMSIFIFVCIIGVLNALIFTGMRAIQTNCNNGTLFKGKQLVNKKITNPLFAGAIYLLIVGGFWFIGFGIPSCILNVDAIADCSTNILIIYFYLIYAAILLGSFINRFTKKVQVVKIQIFPVTCLIGILCCLFIFGFSGIYQNLVMPILNPNAQSSLGLFVEQSNKLVNWQIAIIFWTVFITMALLPLLHDLFIKWWDKKNITPLIWQKNKESVIFK